MGPLRQAVEPARTQQESTGSAGARAPRGNAGPAVAAVAAIADQHGVAADAASPAVTTLSLIHISEPPR
ncbi:hypothetical protein, partial [Mycobacterium kansasii]|uniref:hypothetical protein n=1 Tax=Mycobacterium kansasii TaxID=1768 RepID=UPI00195CF122